MSTGWQPDGSYVPCPDCRWRPPERDDDDAPGVALHMPGTVHKASCPQVAFTKPSRELLDRLVEMDRVRRRGAAEARNFFIG